jgi:N-methylhydantoinase A
VVGLDRLSWDQASAALAELEARGRGVLHQGRVADPQITLEISADMRYAGQGFEVTVPLAPASVAAHDSAALHDAFDAQYRERFGRSLGGMPVELVSWRVRAVAPPSVTELRFAELVVEDDASIERRPAYFAEAGGFVTTPVYARAALEPGVRIEGPALIEETESTAVIGPTAHATVDAFGNLMMTLR